MNVGVVLLAGVIALVVAAGLIVVWSRSGKKPTVGYGDADSDLA